MLLSKRGKRAINQPLRADLDLFYEAMENRYDESENPDGVFTLCIAENILNWKEMEAKLREVAAGPIPDWVPSYTAILGAPPLREAAAGLLKRFLAGVDLDAERLAIAAGAAAVIEMCALLLGDPGDVVVIPGPAYMAYTPDIANKAELERYDLFHLAPSTASASGGPAPRKQDANSANYAFPTYYELTTDDLDRAHAELGDRFRVLLLTQPNNPTGQVYTEQQIADFSNWCVEREIHLVFNEIYALSMIDQDHDDLIDDYGERRWFTSSLRWLEQQKSPYLHWWYAISKDFGLSGLRLGMAYTYNEDLLKAWSNYGSTSMTSNHTQWMMAEIFTDLDWVAAFVRANTQRLSDSYATVIQVLRKHDIAYARAMGSLFVWLDLSAFLTADTEEAELALWREVYDKTGILLTSPVGMGSPQRGWLRMVYSCVSLAELGVAMARFDHWLGLRPGN
ncbi:aminotransferase class I/II-fold pyridoxal phosphate-dependent enzyme [Neolewinella agarilytica]|uniref:aminotransferase class I/II-fold pyridoxal phosphate-dependent enzyme n=1 Tax=Neolewinella agarilytica TaxID=478744 RepID=UPI0023548625|nr:aminotransferase class I/II-fold pyridoxal phosphate-dependent enzyme [Neolewinella agarilytica]